MFPINCHLQVHFDDFLFLECKIFLHIICTVVVAAERH